MPNKDVTDLAALMGEAAEAMAAGTAVAQAAGLAVLKAELAALAHVLPGDTAPESAEDAERRRLAEDAAQEDGFDNMPV